MHAKQFAVVPINDDLRQRVVQLRFSASPLRAWAHVLKVLHGLRRKRSGKLVLRMHNRKGFSL
jgi:hypothetical protein